MITPAAFVPDPQVLDLELTVNGQVMQKSNTSRMVFTVMQAIAHLSRFLTLEPGDVIATGTPLGPVTAPAGRSSCSRGTSLDVHLGLRRAGAIHLNELRAPSSPTAGQHEGSTMKGKTPLEEHYENPAFPSPGEQPYSDDRFVAEITEKLRDPAIRIEEMDRFGIEATIVSLTSPGVEAVPDATQAVKLAREQNDYAYATYVEPHRGRLLSFAAVAPGPRGGGRRVGAGRHPARLQRRHRQRLLQHRRRAHGPLPRRTRRSCRSGSGPTPWGCRSTSTPASPWPARSGPWKDILRWPAPPGASAARPPSTRSA